MNFKDLIAKHGATNVMFMVPMRPTKTMFGLIAYKSSSDPTATVPCQIDLDSRYKVEDNYKVTLKSTYEGFGSESFYISDLEQIIRSGGIQVWLKPVLDYPLASKE